VPPGYRVAHPTATAEGLVVNLGPTELIIVLVILMLLFGANRLPKLARSLGQSAKEFKGAATTLDNEAQGSQS